MSKKLKLDKQGVREILDEGRRIEIEAVKEGSPIVRYVNLREEIINKLFE